jgi:hypothetical protein
MNRFKQIIDITGGITEEGAREPTPVWLTDTSIPAPCPCGNPMDEENPFVLIESESGLKRLIHIVCLGPGMVDDDDDEA